MTLEATIGLEVHAELRTATKMFCRSKNDSNEERPNQNICPVCLAHPGALPVINKEAVRAVLRVGTAVGGSLADYTEFDRKNYFYPDLPKGYQISQYEFPLVSGGAINGVQLTRIHLEEDTASSIHDEKTGATVIDYNRGGVPLMELVTEPVIKSAEQAGAFARELQLLLRYLGVSDANMEKGEMRVEANVSVAEPGKRGTKVEIKNINSFNFMERAVAYEIKRQTSLIEEGKAVIQETRGWNDAKQETFSQRVKEGFADYRYFPDPDLPSLRISEFPEFSVDTIRKTLPVLPWEKRAKYLALGLTPVVANQFVTYPNIGSYFDSVIATKSGNGEFAKRAANYIANDVVSIIRDMVKRDTDNNAEIMDIIDISSRISVPSFAEILSFIESGKLTSRGAKDLLRLVAVEGGLPSDIAERERLFVADVDLDSVIADIVNEHGSVAQDYRAGKEAALQFLVGQGMRKLKGAVDPVSLREAFVKQLKS